MYNNHNKALTLILFVIFTLQSCEKKSKQNIKHPTSTKEKTEEWTEEKDREVAGSLNAKFDDDDLDDDFKIKKNEDPDEIIQSVLSVSLSSQKKDININLLNNSVLYNNADTDYYTSFTISEKKVCTVIIEYADQKSIPNISGEKKNLTEKIKYRFNNQNHKIQVIGYELTYQKDKKFIKKSFNFLTGKFIATRKVGKEISTISGWAKELTTIYTENWTFPFVRDKIFWYGNEIE